MADDIQNVEDLEDALNAEIGEVQAVADQARRLQPGDAAVF